MKFHRNSYLVRVLPCVLFIGCLACDKTESDEDKDSFETSGISDPDIKDEPDYDNYYYSGCVAAHPAASYQMEYRRIIFNKNGTYEAETVGYDSADCGTAVVAVIKAGGGYVWKEATEDPAVNGFRLELTRTSLKVRVIGARELDHWNGTLTALPVCDAFKSKLGDEIEMINMKCLDADNAYQLAPQTTWAEDVRTGEWTTPIYLSGLVFGHFPALQAHQASTSVGEAVPMKTLSSFQEGEKHYVGGYGYSGIVNSYYTLGSQLAGSWQACHEENLVTFTFSGSNWVQSAQVDVGADCTGSPAYTMSFSGTFSVVGGLDYVEGGYKINYTNSTAKYTVHTQAALDELFNGITTGTTAFCSGFSFVLDTETSINGKSCKPRPDIEADYTTVGSFTLYDIILFRDNEITDSRFTEEGQGASSTTRPYFFNGDLVYTKL